MQLSVTLQVESLVQLGVCVCVCVYIYITGSDGAFWGLG
jgi:hypothetical protein